MVGRADLVYFFVSDMDRAVAFYRDVLELELIRRSGEEWSQLAAGSVQVGLHGAGSGPVRPGGTLAFTVEDLDGNRFYIHCDSDDGGDRRSQGDRY